MGYKVSIIVPVYNVQCYLDKCISSIIAQTYHNIEIILIDDGSTDKSGEICDKYASIDSRIVVYHKPNGGLSSARNYGIERACGKFISFIDSDDFVNSDYIATLLDQCGDADISICYNRKISEYEKLDVKEIQTINNEKVNSHDALIRFFNDNTYVSAWGKLYPTEFFSDVRFPEGKIYEDYATIYKLLAKANKIILKKAELYYYTMRPNSITNSPFSEKNLDMFDILESIKEYIDKSFWDADIKEAFLGSKARCLLSLYYKIYISNNAALYKEKQDFITTFIHHNKKSILKSKHIHNKTKFAILIFCVSKKIFALVMSKLHV